MRILAAGDIHGDRSLAERLAEKAEKENADLVIITGDITHFDQSADGIMGPFVKKNKKVLNTFENFSYSCKKEYLMWVTEAKTEETRNSRLATAIEWMSEGKRRNWKYER